MNSAKVKESAGLIFTLVSMILVLALWWIALP
jgi:hypothetical protein